MKKKHLYIALGVFLVLVLGLVAYLGMQGGGSYQDGPPTLEENTALTGTLTADGHRYFNVETVDLEGDDLKGYSPKSPKNFLLFTTPSSDADFNGLNTISEAMEALIVDDGKSGYVLGTYRPDEGGWHLAPEKNYIGANRMEMSDNLNTCETYFVIKIDDKHSGWTGSEREEIAFDADVFETLNAGTETCSMVDRGIVEDSWNLASVKYESGDINQRLLDELSIFDNVFAVWDTAIINQIDRNVDPVVVVNANKPLYRNGNWEKGLEDVVTAGLTADEQTYDGGKFDLWVYVGNVLPEVNEPPVVAEKDVRIDLTEEINDIRQEAVANRSLDIIDARINAPGYTAGKYEPVVFASVDPEGGEVVYSNTNPNFVTDKVNQNPDSGITFDRDASGDLSLDSYVYISNTEYSLVDIFAGLIPSNAGNGNVLLERSYDLSGEFNDNETTVVGEAGVTFEWTNSCIEKAQSYSNHVANVIKGMIMDRMDTEEDYLAARETVFSAIRGEVAGNEGYLELAAQFENAPQIVVTSEDLDNPPYLVNECGSGFAACVDAYICEHLIDPQPKDVVGFGRIVEKVAVNAVEPTEESSQSSLNFNGDQFAEVQTDSSSQSSLNYDDGQYVDGAQNTESKSTLSTEEEPIACQKGEEQYYNESIEDYSSCDPWREEGTESEPTATSIMDSGVDMSDYSVNDGNASSQFDFRTE